MDETDTEVTGRCDCPLVAVTATVAQAGSKGEFVVDDVVAVVVVALANRAFKYPL